MTKINPREKYASHFEIIKLLQIEYEHRMTKNHVLNGMGESCYLRINFTFI